MVQRSESLRLLTLNVNGLRDSAKIARLFWFVQLAGGNPDVVLLQELHLSCEEDLRAAMQHGRGRGMPYYGLSYFSGGTEHSCGVAILLRAGGLLDDDLPASAVHRDTEGRWVRIDCTLLRQPLSICCVYAPNTARTVFFSGLHDHVPAGGRVIMGGDFNCVCDPLLDQHPPSQTHTSRGEGAPALAWLLAQRGLVDAYREAEPAGVVFTHTATHARSLPAQQQSRARLDRWYISEECREWKAKVQHLPCSLAGVGGAGAHGGGGEGAGGLAPGDHAAVLLVLTPPGLPTIGPGQASFPVHLLFDCEYLQELESYTQQYFQLHPAPPAAQPGAHFWWWVTFKRALTVHGRALGRRWQREQLEALWGKVPAIAAAAAAFAGAGPHAGAAASAGGGGGAGAAAPAAAAPAVPPPPPVAAPTSAAPPLGPGGGAAPRDPPGLASLAGACADRVAVAQAIVHNEAGERCTAYHFSQAGAGKRASIVSELTAADGEVLDMSKVVCGADLRHVTHSHFSSAHPTGLFRVGSPDVAAQDELLADLPRKLNGQQSKEAEGPKADGTITVACLSTALGVCEWGKAPGPDGLPFEVYKQLWTWMGPALVLALRDLFAHGASGPEWAEGLITLIYKKGGKPRDRLSSYRPITLLNCDIKLVGRVLSDRMQPALDYLIDPAQTAFIRGRQITDNVFNRQALIDYLEASGAGAPPTGCLLFLDIAKAYDRVDRAWLMRCASAFGLPLSMQRWMRLVMDGTTARVNVNSWHSPAFPVDNGLPQGGPPCPLLWVLQLEPLTVALRRAAEAGTIVTPTLPCGVRAPPASHHADDTMLATASHAVYHPVMWPIVRKWQAASNADMQDDKQGGLGYGAGRIAGLDAASGMRFWQEGEPRPVSLGVPCTSDHAAAADAAYDAKLGKVQGLARIWGRVPQSLAGRALTAQQLLSSQTTYLMPLLPPTTQSRDHLGGHQRAIHQFVARSAAAEDRTLNNGSALSLLPPPRIASLSRYLGGLSVPDLGSQYASLAAKMVVLALLPGAQLWKAELLHQLAAAAPHPNWGISWVTTRMPLSHCKGLGARAAAAVHMFRMLCVQPHTPPPLQELPRRALLLMPLFYTELLTDANGEQFTPPTVDLPDDWPFTLGQLARCSDATRGYSTLQRITAALPLAWRAALDAVGRGDVDRWADDQFWVGERAGQRYVRDDRGGAPACHALVLHSGALYWLDASAQAEACAVTLWSPACVLQGPKKSKLWSPADRAMVAAAAAGTPGERAAARPVQSWLLGAWSDVQLYPDAWAHGRLPLSQYTAANSRLITAQYAAGVAAAPYMPNYQPGKAVRPRLWELQPGVTAGSSVAGLEALEQQWVASQRAREAVEWEEPRQRELARMGMDLAAAPNVRRPPVDRSGAGPSGLAGGASGSGSGTGAAAGSSGAVVRASPARQQQQQEQGLLRRGTLLARLALDVEAERARQAAEGRGGPTLTAATAGAGPAPPDIHAKYWRMLWDDVPVGMAVKCFAVRLLHACLPCHAMHASLQGIRVTSMRAGRPFAACRCCSGKDARGRYVFETYTHLFCGCPAFSGAKGWLQDLWESISGSRPPDTAAAIVADAPDAWPAGQRPVGDQLLLWQALRLSLLFNIWAARCSDDPEQRSSRAVVAATVAAVRGEVQMQFHRTYQRSALLRALPAAVFSRQQQRPPTANLGIWLCPAIASVTTAAQQQQPAAGQPPPPPPVRRLTLHLTLQHPVPAPPAAPGEPPDPH